MPITFAIFRLRSIYLLSKWGIDKIFQVENDYFLSDFFVTTTFAGLKILF